MHSLKDIKLLDMVLLAEGKMKEIKPGKKVRDWKTTHRRRDARRDEMVNISDQGLV